MAMASRILGAGISAAALTLTASAASAGGFAVREQSTVFLGSAFAGAAAGGSLGSMFWNSAATATFDGPGIHTESSYTLILPDADVTVSTVGGGPIPASISKSGDIGIDAVVGASYGAYQVAPDIWLGMALNSPFGLGTKPENNNYAGAVLGRTTKLLTINANPTVAYRVAPGVIVGGGAQIEWARGKLQFATGFPPGAPTAQFKGDDYAFGATAGIMLQPATGTSIGLGWRSSLTHELDGTFSTPLGGAPAKAKVKLPDIVTLSLRQVVASNMRVLGTVEWTNWSRFDKLTLSNGLKIDANWSDGWFFSGGGEYDYSVVSQFEI